MNPYVLAGAVVALVLAAGGGFHFGSNYAKGKAAREEVLIAKAGEAAQQAAAAAIAKIKVVNQTNRTRIEREIVKVPDLATCNAGDAVKRVLDDALTNRASSEAANGGVVSRTDVPGK